MRRGSSVSAGSSSPDQMRTWPTSQRDPSGQRPPLVTVAAMSIAMVVLPWPEAPARMCGFPSASQTRPNQEAGWLLSPSMRPTVVNVGPELSGGTDEVQTIPAHRIGQHIPTLLEAGHADPATRLPVDPERVAASMEVAPGGSPLSRPAQDEPL